MFVLVYLFVFEYVMLYSFHSLLQVGEILGEAWELGMVGTYAQVLIIVIIAIVTITVTHTSLQNPHRLSWAMVLSSVDLN